MKTRSAEAVVRIMVSKDPRQSVDTILEFLLGVNGAPAGAVFTVHGEPQPRLFVSHGIGQNALDWTAACWTRDAESLAIGRLSRDAGSLLYPILRGQSLVALVYLQVPQVDLASLAEVSRLLADAVVKASAKPELVGAVETFLEQTPTEEIERQRLVILLDRFEWNVARVARELGKTRTTIYKRLALLGIPRKRVPKDGRLRESPARS